MKIAETTSLKCQGCSAKMEISPNIKNPRVLCLYCGLEAIITDPYIMDLIKKNSSEAVVYKDRLISQREKVFEEIGKVINHSILDSAVRDRFKYTYSRSGDIHAFFANEKAIFSKKTADDIKGYIYGIGVGCLLGMFNVNVGIVWLVGWALINRNKFSSATRSSCSGFGCGFFLFLMASAAATDPNVENKTLTFVTTILCATVWIKTLQEMSKDKRETMQQQYDELLRVENAVAGKIEVITHINGELEKI